MAKKFQNNKQSADINGKMQPQAIDLEISVLGAILIDNEALSDSIDILNQEYYYYKNYYHPGCILMLLVLP